MYDITIPEQLLKMMDKWNNIKISSKWLNSIKVLFIKYFQESSWHVKWCEDLIMSCKYSPL